MNTSPPSENIEAAVRNYGSTLYRLGLAMLYNTAEAEDAVQETFLRYVEKSKNYQSAEHEKAWLIRVCINQCRDILRIRKRRSGLDIDHGYSDSEPPCSSGIMEALQLVPEKFRLVLTLHYVEGYSVNDIAKVICRTPSAVKMRLQKGRKILEDIYRKEYM